MIKFYLPQFMLYEIAVARYQDDFKRMGYKVLSLKEHMTYKTLRNKKPYLILEEIKTDRHPQGTVKSLNE